MKRNFVLCDHCGKVLDTMHDYDDIDIIICSPIPSCTADLCKDCFQKLIDNVEKYIHAADENEKTSETHSRQELFDKINNSRAQAP